MIYLVSFSYLKSEFLYNLILRVWTMIGCDPWDIFP